MVVWDGVGYYIGCDNELSLLFYALCLPLPSLHDSDFYEIFLLLVCVFLVNPGYVDLQNKSPAA